MSAALAIRPMTAADMAAAQGWMDDSAEGFLGCDWAYLLEHLHDPRSGWTLTENDRPVAVALCHHDGARCWFERLVDPAERGRGLGAAFLRLLAGHPDMTGYVSFWGSVHVDNLRCRANLASLGFIGLDAAPDRAGQTTVHIYRETLAAGPAVASGNAGAVR